MASSQLPNYLRANRKRLALSQKEVAFLLGAESGAKVCRYERFAREPSLRTALAYEVIFQRPARELFGGLHKALEKQVAARARSLGKRVNRESSKARHSRKRESISALAALAGCKPLNQE